MDRTRIDTPGMYAVEAGRGITYNGVRVATLVRDSVGGPDAPNLSPVEADALVHNIVDLLNLQNETIAQITADYRKGG